MSWQLFRSSMGVLTGNQHVSHDQFSDVLSKSYHECVLRHVDMMTGGGAVIGADSKLKPLKEGILSICEQNLSSGGDPHFLEQLTPFLYAYWAGLTVIGPIGVVAITGTGTYTSPKVVQNLDFNIILTHMVTSYRVHISTLIGIYTSTVILTPLLVCPWSGGSLQTMG